MGTVHSTDFSTHRRALDCIAQGSLTNSKRPESFVQGSYPTHVVSGQGSFLVDESGKKYVDFLCALGANILGYAHSSINHAVLKQLELGTLFSLGSTLEVTCAEKIKSVFPFIDVMKFLKTGSEATHAALRIARTKTGRSEVMSEGFHAWHNEFVSLTPPALGVPKHNDIEKLNIENISEQTAAVIVEPIITDNSQSRIEWLRLLRKRCDETGTVLIFDEIITGYRFPKFSVSNYYGIYPDIICLGKAIANGLPLSVVAGKKHIMNCGEYFVSSTFAGETLSLAACIKTTELLQTKYKLDTLFEKANYFQQEFNKLAPEIIKINGYGTRGSFEGSILNRALFCQEACRAGILFHPSTIFFNYPHIDLIDMVLNSVKDILYRIKTGKVKLNGELPKTPFSQQVREKL